MFITGIVSPLQIDFTAASSLTGSKELLEVFSMKLSTLFPHCQKPETFGLGPPVFYQLGFEDKPAHPLAQPAPASRGQHHSAQSPQGFAALGAWDNFPLAGTTVRLALLSSSRLGALEFCLPSEGAWLTSRLDSICSAQAHRKCFQAGD